MQPGVDFTNILRAAYLPIFLRKKTPTSTVSIEKLRIKLLVQKCCSSNVVEIDTAMNASSARVYLSRLLLSSPLLLRKSQQLVGK